MNKNRVFAKLSGWSIILMAIIAGFSIGFVYPKIYDASQFDLIQSKLMENFQLYKLMLIGILFIILLDILVSWTLYLFFRNDNQKVALLSFILRITYSLIFIFASYHLIKNLGLVNNNVMLVRNFQLFQATWSIGLIIFGFHLIVIGVLMKLHQSVPKILWYLAIIAGLSYILVHTLKTASPHTSELNSSLETILSLPMALGELALAFWLIIKGSKKEQILF